MLGPIFTHNLPALVFGYAAFMVAVGATESAARPSHTYAGMTLHVIACLGVAAFAFLSYAMAAVVRPHPWWSAQFFVPTLGVMLGNAVSGVAVGLGALLEDLATGGDRVELLLALGASRREACRDAVARAVRLALTPIMNQMNVIGLVWIPGMMTGQMIAGSDPSQVRAGGGRNDRSRPLFFFSTALHPPLPRPPVTKCSSCFSWPPPPRPPPRPLSAWPPPRWSTPTRGCGATACSPAPSAWAGASGARTQCAPRGGATGVAAPRRKSR